MADKIILTEAEPAITEWTVDRLEIVVSAGVVNVGLVADTGATRLYQFTGSTEPTAATAMTAINRHDGSTERLNAWILRQLQNMDPALAGTVEST